MTPAPPQNGSRLVNEPEDYQNDRTPNLAGNKNNMLSSGGKPPSAGVFSASKPAGMGKPGLFAKPKMGMKKKFQMDVVQDDKVNAALNVIANKQSLLKPQPNISHKPSFQSSSPGVRKRESAQSILAQEQQLLGAGLNQGKGMNRDSSQSSVGSAQKKVSDNFAKPTELV